MGFSNPSDYGNIENRRAEQNKILKWKRRVYVAVSAVMSLIIVNFFFSNSEDMFSSAQLFVNWSNISDSYVFETKAYLYISGSIVVTLYALFLFPSKQGIIRRFEVIGKRNKKPSLFLKLEFYIVTAIDKGLLYLFYPISYFIFNVGDKDKKTIEKFYLRVGWLEHIENSFFKEVAIKVDGYSRVKELDMLEKYKEFFSSKRGDGLYNCSTYKTIYKIFLNEKSMTDLMMIIEGYLADKDEPKFDKNLSRTEYKNALNNKYKGEQKKFRCYNGIDEVRYSHDLIKDVIDTESANFKEYMFKYATSSRQTFTRAFLKNFRHIKKDKKILKKIAGFNLPDVVEVKTLSDDKVLTSRIIELCEAYFRIVAFKHIIGQYMNLPAGTMVVKIEDYTARMIIEMYDEEALIQIIDNKNDGRSKDFNSDALVNIFLAAYNYYNLSSNYSLLARVDDIFNFRDEEADEEIIQEINKDAKVSNFEGGYREASTEELAHMRANLDKKYK